MYRPLPDLATYRTVPIKREEPAFAHAEKMNGKWNAANRMFIALVGKGDFGSEGNGLDKGGKIVSQKRMRRSWGDHYVLRKIKMNFKAHISFLATVLWLLRGHKCFSNKSNRCRSAEAYFKHSYSVITFLIINYWCTSSNMDSRADLAILPNFN